MGQTGNNHLNLSPSITPNVMCSRQSPKVTNLQLAAVFKNSREKGQGSIFVFCPSYNYVCSCHASKQIRRIRRGLNSKPVFGSALFESDVLLHKMRNNSDFLRRLKKLKSNCKYFAK